MSSYLSTGWVDADGVVQLLLGETTFHCYTKALRHLSSIWTQIVEPNDSILQREHNHSRYTTRGCKLLVATGSELIQLCKSSNNLTLSSLLQRILA